MLECYVHIVLIIDRIAYTLVKLYVIHSEKHCLIVEKIKEKYKVLEAK